MVPSILMTANPTRAVELAALELGVITMLRKPIPAEVLQIVVEQVLRPRSDRLSGHPRQPFLIPFRSIPDMAKTANKTAIRPLGDKVLVQRLKAAEKSAGGIVLPDSAKEKPAEGTIVAIGEGRLMEDGQRKPFTVKKGDRILFTSYAGTEVKWDGEEYLIMSEDDILGIVG
jgi:chaperonin GroES